MDFTEFNNRLIAVHIYISVKLAFVWRKKYEQSDTQADRATETEREGGQICTTCKWEQIMHCSGRCIERADIRKWTGKRGKDKLLRLTRDPLSHI